MTTYVCTATLGARTVAWGWAFIHTVLNAVTVPE